MEKRKEFFKTLILSFLVVSSILLTFNIAGYKPKYDILGTTQDKKTENQDYAKLKSNSLNLLSPDIIIETNSNYREEQAIPLAITKLSNVNAIKDRAVIKNILSTVASNNIEETRFRNKPISEVLKDYNKIYTFRYKHYIDTISSKLIYLGENNSNTKFDFDTVILVDNKPNNIYLYKEGIDNYFQIELDNNIFEKIEKEFEQHKKSYYKYSIDGIKKIYIEDKEDYYIDIYSYDEIDLRDVSNDIFLRNSNVKYSNIIDDNKEVTDGYSILRKSDNAITYINPSNISETKNNTDIQSRAASFLVYRYLPNNDYSILDIIGNEIVYKEIYKGSSVYSKDYSSSIKINVSSEGIYNVKYPLIIKNNLLSSEKMKEGSLENISAIMNYLYYNTNLNDVEDIELSYDKTYSKNKTFIYTPNWYIKYKGKYISYSDLKIKISRGEV
ncbi:two-component system activity regulator YycH [Gemelliphila palaticanis]|uniref:Regulatory protein YycH domain-containing protein n=1 Tax=Gemelliphila palaticanis TaxID=81950 RepID=A0ABX2T0B0_9BACL|nr:two-component system activity regulator YycH [Gemella palaticanis]MBF0716153.1 hypothetical protein [Gemella palaticanis]NYS48083.1 hypothetical protein [Gemella palaticanis]